MATIYRRKFFISLGSAALFLALVPGAQGQQPVSDHPRQTVCDVSMLPPDVQISLKNELVSWKIVEPGDLNTTAREKWMAEKPTACPGIAAGRFENSDMRTYAVLLIHTDHESTGYKFLTFSHKPGQLSYDEAAIEESQESLPGSFPIRAVRLKSVLDAKARKQLKASAPEGILFTDWAEQHHNSEIYFWAESHYQHQTIKQ